VLSAQPGGYLRRGFMMGAGEELPAAHARLLILCAAENGC
jgi:hypothetical protein